MWGIGGDEKHRDALAPADLVLIYLAPPKQEFIGRAELASAVHDWTSAEAEVYPGDSPCGVVLSHVEEWDPPVAMNTVVPRIDLEGSNPLVQQNAKAGFQTGVIRITPHEYETVLAVRAERRALDCLNLDSLPRRTPSSAWPYRSGCRIWQPRISAAMRALSESRVGYAPLAETPGDPQV
jgi:hypothetical protein